ncbi:MAG: IS4 family transposase [Planctomycetes bacterium]|nr:IS4 family transposase [Planctomycetota bacterium]
MNAGKMVFAQVIDCLPKYDFCKCVKRYKGDYNIKTFSCMDQFLCMTFAQLTYRESLRDIEVCLRANRARLYHMGIRSRPSRSTLAYANENRDWRIYADLAQVLIRIAKDLYADEDIGIDVEGEVYALDSTTIDLCLSLFPWADFRKTKAAVKAHTLLNVRGDIPEFIHISDGKLHDVNVLDILVIQAGSYYVMDRAYVDFRRLYRMDQGKATFVTRAKVGFQFKRRYSHSVEKSTGLRSDQTIVLTGVQTQKEYPSTLRRIRYYDTVTERNLIFLTNNFVLPALVIAQLYKLRWRVELFFKWIKQHLRVKAFYGTSENAVKTQIWIAICTYMLVLVLRKQLSLSQSTYTILQFLSVSIFEKTPISMAFSDSDITYRNEMNHNQLLLFDL